MHDHSWPDSGQSTAAFTSTRQVPVRMLRGQLPAAGVLERLGLPQYAPLAEAVRSGALRGLNRALLADQHRFIMEARSRHPLQNSATTHLYTPPTWRVVWSMDPPHRGCFSACVVAVGTPSDMYSAHVAEVIASYTLATGRVPGP